MDPKEKLFSFNNNPHESEIDHSYRADLSLLDLLALDLEHLDQVINYLPSVKTELDSVKHFKVARYKLCFQQKDVTVLQFRLLQTLMSDSTQGVSKQEQKILKVNAALNKQFIT